MLLILIMMKAKLEKSEQHKQEKRILTKLSKHSLLVRTSRENGSWKPYYHFNILLFQLDWNSFIKSIASTSRIANKMNFIFYISSNYYTRSVKAAIFIHINFIILIGLK